MAITEDIRRVVTDPKPFHALVGTADLAVEKAKEVPGAVEKLIDEAPKRFEAVHTTDPKEIQERVTRQAREAQNWLTELLGTLDSDFRKLSQQAQDAALQGVGRVAEAAVRVQEEYGKLAERGEKTVQAWRGEVAEELHERADEAHELAEVIEPDAESEGERKAAAKKTTAKKTTAKKTTPAKKTTSSSSASPSSPTSSSSSSSASPSSSASSPSSSSSSTSTDDK